MQTFSELRTPLGSDIKSMDWIKLIGYSVDDEVTSSQVHRGKLHLKQWVAVHVKGLIGTTISNEPAAHDQASMHALRRSLQAQTQV